MAREQVRFGDMETNVLFDSIGNRSGAIGANTVDLLTEIEFNFPFQGIRLAAPPGSDFPFMNFGNSQGKHVLSVGSQLDTAGIWTGEITRLAGAVPVATGNGKLYTAVVSGLLLQVLNEATGAIIIAALNPLVGTLQGIYGSKSGAFIVLTGTTGVAVLDTATDLVTNFPSTIGFNFEGPFISENDSFVMAYKVSTNEVHYFITAGALIASYPNPAGSVIIGSTTNFLAVNSAGSMAWQVFTDPFLAQKVMSFIPATGVPITTVSLGQSSQPIQATSLIYSEAIDRLAVRWDVGYQLNLFTASTLGVVNNKTNMPKYQSISSLMKSMALAPDGNSILLISDSFYDSAVRVIDITGAAVPFGAGALTTLNVIGSPFSRMNFQNGQTNIRGFVSSFNGDRVFLAPLNFTGHLYAAGALQNRIRVNTVSPLNGGTLLLDGSVALPPLRTLYVDMISPTGGSSETSFPASYPFGAIRVNRFAPKVLVGDVEFGDNNLNTTDQSFFFTDIETYGLVDTFGSSFYINSGDFGFFGTFAEFSGAQLEINSPTDVNGTMNWFTFAQVEPAATINWQGGATLFGQAGATFTWGGTMTLSSASPMESSSGYSSGLGALFPNGIRVNSPLGITTDAPATDLVLNGLSGNITSSSHFKTTQDLECLTPSSFAGGAPADRGLVLKDNAGVRWRVTVSTLGALRVFLA